MSARAALRLETMGFREIHRYAAGKLDWVAHALPIEGEWASEPNIGEAADKNVPTCDLATPIVEARMVAESAGWGVCVVINDDRVVLGLLDAKALESSREARAEDLMRPGPSTYRPYLFVSEAADFLKERKLSYVLVTDSDGKLIGVLRKQDIAEVQASNGTTRQRSATRP